MVKSKDADFEESKHKRDEGGKFSAGGHAAAAKTSGFLAGFKKSSNPGVSEAHAQAAEMHKKAEAAHHANHPDRNAASKAAFKASSAAKKRDQFEAEHYNAAAHSGSAGYHREQAAVHEKAGNKEGAAAHAKAAELNEAAENAHKSGHEDRFDKSRAAHAETEATVQAHPHADRGKIPAAEQLAEFGKSVQPGKRDANGTLRGEIKSKSSTTAVNNTLGSMRGHASYLRELEHGQAFTHRPNAETGKFDRLNSHEAAERTLKNARELHSFVHTNSSDPKHHEAATKTLKNLEKLAEKVKAREPYSK